MTRAATANPTSETGARVNAVAEWRSALTAVAGGAMLYLTLSGLFIYLLRFSVFVQFTVVVHTIIGVLSLVPVVWYCVRHWWVRKRGNLSHYQILGYAAVALLAACVVSGAVVTVQGITGPRISPLWDMVHLVTGVGFGLLVVVHIATVMVRTVKNPQALRLLRGARRRFFLGSGVICGLLVAAAGVWAGTYVDPDPVRSFSDDYDWRFGKDRPFAPSQARVERTGVDESVQARVVDALNTGQRTAYLAAFAEKQPDATGLFTKIRTSLDEIGADEACTAAIEDILTDAATTISEQGALDTRALAGSAGCGTSGCHSDVYEEWLPSAHRYSSLDDMFQRVQTLMAVETSPEHTRYCAGCHDPISLFAGAKNSSNVTLSTHGSDEGSSCLVCHSIVQADVQGNGDYTIRPPRRYSYETDDGALAKFVSDFLIRTYPRQHVESYSRPLYKTPEFCAACHKQYLDKEVNTDIGKVQGQNQYDSWKNSRWHHPEDPEQSISCRDCHMPLVASTDPARGDVTDSNRSGDDGRHRSHRMLASNQYIPVLHDLEGAEEHVALIEQWLRGEYEIPEIADRWVTGPVVRMDIEAPAAVAPGEQIPLRVFLTNNKTGHDFPTGPLDMIESWVELKVTDDSGAVIHHSGALDEAGNVVEPEMIFKADGYDRRGELIDRHNLWDLVGASYKRSMYPGMTDAINVDLQCPSMARGRVAAAGERTGTGQRVEDFDFAVPTSSADGVLTVSAVLWYRKANPEFLDRVYGHEAAVRAPATAMTETTFKIEVRSDATAAAE